MENNVWPAIIGQLGTAAVFAFLVWHLITKGIPDLIAGFRQELSEERKARAEQHRASIETMERVGDRLDHISGRMEGCPNCRNWSPRSDPAIPIPPGKQA